MHKMLDVHMHAMHYRLMKLSEFLTDRNLTDDAFAALVGMSQSQVSRLKRGLSRPSWDNLAAIERATDGAVTANDFMTGQLPAGFIPRPPTPRRDET